MQIVHHITIPELTIMAERMSVKDDETLEKWFMQFALAARNPNRVTTTA
jgi:hypothetical protein